LFLAGNPELFELVWRMVEGRGLVITSSKSTIEESFRNPFFPRGRSEFRDLLLRLSPSDSFPGLHVTHGRYLERPRFFGDTGKRQQIGFFIDIDGRPSVKAAARVTRAMADALESLDVPHYVKFSGARGFHIHVPPGAFPAAVDGVPFSEIAPKVFIQAKHFLVRQAIAKLRGLVFETMIHPKHYYETSQGIQRLPFSIHEQTGLPSTPLLDEEISAFRPARILGLDEASLSERVDIARPSGGSADRLLEAAEEESGRTPPPYLTR